MRVFTQERIGDLGRRVRELLATVGYAVEHEDVARILSDRGVRTSASGRFLFEGGIIDELVADRARTTPAPGRRPHAAPPAAAPSAAAADPVRAAVPPFRASFGNEASKYYDRRAGGAVTGRLEHLVRLTKFAHVEERIAGIGMPVIPTDVRPGLAPIEGLLTMMKLTHKHPRRLEPYSAEQIAYYVELSDILLGPGRAGDFVGPCDCINPIMRLERRAAGVMLEKARHGVGNLVTAMPAAGGNAPVTVEGAVIQATAEIVGGLLIAWVLNPDTHHRGYISSGIVDLRTARTSQSAPESVLIDCGVVEVMDAEFGGDTGIGGKTYVAAAVPGLQAVFEKLFKTAAYARMSGDSSYGGAGILDNGSLIAPEQLLLDLEVGESLHRVAAVETRDEGVETAIAAVAAAGTGDFLSADHTLERFKGAFWDPTLFTRGRTRSEAEILDETNRVFDAAVDRYPGYEYDEQEVRSVERVLARAKRNLS